MSERPFPSRRDFLTLAAGAFTVAAVPLAWSRRSRLARRTAPVMGTVAELAVVHPDERYAQRAMGAALAELQRVERLMTRFRADSDVGRLNARTGGGPVVVAAETALVLRAALEWAHSSDGAFDPALARATELWDVGRSHAPPAPDRLHRLAGRSLFRAVDVDGRAGRHVVALRDPEAAIDLGGIAKGFGVDRAVAVLREWGVANGFVNVGGDLYALGRREDDEPWTVGVRAPEEPGRIARTLELSDAAVATSGDYEQFFEHGGRRYHHILDPRTAEPRRTATHSVSVAASSCMDADAAATAVFGVEEAAADRILGGRGRVVRV